MRKSYLYRYFETYPNREVTEAALFEALHYLVSREKLAEMIAQGLAEGWLASTALGSTMYYHRREHYYHRREHNVLPPKRLRR